MPPRCHSSSLPRATTPIWACEAPRRACRCPDPEPPAPERSHGRTASTTPVTIGSIDTHPGHAALAAFTRRDTPDTWCLASAKRTEPCRSSVESRKARVRSARCGQNIRAREVGPLG
jgi:hypothetical protein